MKWVLVSVSIVIIILIVIGTTILWNPSPRETGLLEEKTDCGKIERPLLGVENFDIEVEKVNCFIDNFNKCKESVLTIVPYGFEGEAYPQEFHIKSEKNECFIEKHFYNKLTDKCRSHNIQIDNCIKWDLSDCIIDSNTDTRISICKQK
jgi:hypothetical protein